MPKHPLISIPLDIPDLGRATLEARNSRVRLPLRLLPELRPSGTFGRALFCTGARES